jgi:hypothetical protein
VIEWKRVPWPLWIYSASLLFSATLIEVKAHGPIPAKVLFAAVMLTWLYFLLKGVRWVWIVTVGIYALGFVADLISGSLKWQGVALSLIGFVLLLLPVTRRYFARESVAAGT